MHKEHYGHILLKQEEYSILPETFVILVVKII